MIADASRNKDVAKIKDVAGKENAPLRWIDLDVPVTTSR